jgi:hypothetical protein
MSQDRLPDRSDESLGRALGELPLAWASTVDVVDGVTAAIRAGRRPRWSPSRARVLLLAAAIALALATAAAAAKLVIDLGAVTVERPAIPSLPLPPTLVPIAHLGERMSLKEARDTVGFPVRLPARLGRPDRVWLFETTTSFEPSQESVAVAAAWRHRPGLPRIPGSPFGATLIVFHGDVDVAAKLVGGRIQRVPDHSAVVVSGRHELELLAGGVLRHYRVTGTVVLWQRGSTTARLETALPSRDAIMLAFG